MKAVAKGIRVSDVNICRPTQPDFRFIEWLHRGHGEGVSFHSKSSSEFKDLGGLRPGELATCFPALREHFEGKDCYFSINGGRLQKRRDNTLPTGLRVRRRSRDVCFLNSLFVDMDLYKAGLSVPDAERELDALVQEGCIPQPNVILYSGRGMWAFWRLAENGKPVVVTDNTVSLFNAFQKQLVRALSMLEADPKSSDIARITRIPGTLNTTSGERVGYRQTAGRHDYGLDEIGELLEVCSGRLIVNGVDVPAAPDAFAAPFSPDDPDSGEAPRRKGGSLDFDVPDPNSFTRLRARKGFAVVTDARCKQFLALSRIRGGFREGHRNHALIVYCVLYRDLRRVRDRQVVSESETTEAAIRASATFKPPLSRIECERAGKWAVGNKRKLRDRTISNWLEISPDEETALAQKFPDLKSTWKRADKFYAGGIPPVDLPKRTAAREHRRTLIREYLECCGEAIPTLRGIGQHLDALQCVASVATIRKDLAEMGIQNPRLRKPVC